MSFQDYLRRDVRLVILRVLSEMPEYRANSSVITNVLDQFGHAVTRDQVKTELRWLEEQGLIQLAEVGSVLVATLLERGQDVARGRAKVDGVAKPGA
ncbi:VpaChn25_0724 family phage protein [Azonexus fungiphilus]|uniref:VpaChn25_0724 family phage protein n=1 Tax=Azonexus fungiphilus TaxID=146940 RepID=UPI00156AF043|nr:ArsR family transcriptional regulator [Azonexus fungiphilus]